MKSGTRSPAVVAIEVLPAIALGAAAALFAWRLQGGSGAIAPVAAGSIAALSAWMLAGWAGRRETAFALPEFDRPSWDSFAAELESAAVPGPLHFPGDGGEAGAQVSSPSPAEGADDELLLDEPLDQALDERVIPLFGSTRFPTAGEVQERIARHLEQRDCQAGGPDATRELHEALAQLRQSLR